ncbi:hypothetical protein BKA70DRAFT_490493 [Coprinopsis sp. MPI-PUGE-AT-0042]|nr:hypothetical protein BKA70DRAFT_490493 [Coprinopsis sp. MPI-PUGE-AT-0042]
MGPIALLRWVCFAEKGEAGNVQLSTTVLGESSEDLMFLAFSSPRPGFQSPHPLRSLTSWNSSKETGNANLCSPHLAPARSPDRTRPLIPMPRSIQRPINCFESSMTNLLPLPPPVPHIDGGENSPASSLSVASQERNVLFARAVGRDCTNSRSARSSPSTGRHGGLQTGSTSLRTTQKVQSASASPFSKNLQMAKTQTAKRGVSAAVPLVVTA